MHRRVRVWWVVGALCWCCLLGACTSMLEDRFIFFPETQLIATPAAVGLPYEEVYFTTQDAVRLHGWFVPVPDARWTILWFHGNAGNISHRLDLLQQMHRHVPANIFLFDYRQYGRSQGTISEQGTYVDASAAWQTIQQRFRIAPQAIVLFGQSLGSAIAIDLAQRAPCGALILEAPFTSIPDMAAVAFPWLPVGRWLRTRYDSLQKIPRVMVPLLVLHGDYDDVVPLAQGQRLFAAANEPKTWYAIPGAGHNDTYLVGGALYWQVWTRFLAAL